MLQIWQRSSYITIPKETSNMRFPTSFGWDFSQPPYTLLSAVVKLYEHLKSENNHFPLKDKKTVVLLM